MTQAALALDFSFDFDRTVLRVLRQEPPWRALRAFQNASGEALIHLHNVSGGILGGDELTLNATLQPHAQAQIAAVGATRIYRHRHEKPPASQFTRFHVANGALLEYLPDTVIPFAHSRFEQKSEIYLDKGAGLIYWETLCAGRIASGERFAFENISFNTSIYAEGIPVAMERYSLNPRVQQLSSPLRFGPFLYSATMFVCQVNDEQARWFKLENDLNEIAGSLSAGGVKWGASTLVRHGVVVRGMAQTSHAISNGLRTMWQAAKQNVWGRPALPPRKIY